MYEFSENAKTNEDLKSSGKTTVVTVEHTEVLPDFDKFKNGLNNFVRDKLVGGMFSKYYMYKTKDGSEAIVVKTSRDGTERNSAIVKR